MVALALAHGFTNGPRLFTSNVWLSRDNETLAIEDLALYASNRIFFIFK